MPELQAPAELGDHDVVVLEQGFAFPFVWACVVALMGLGRAEVLVGSSPENINLVGLAGLPQGVDVGFQ